jgi:hypothetical protein
MLRKMERRVWIIPDGIPHGQVKRYGPLNRVGQAPSGTPGKSLNGWMIAVDDFRGLQIRCEIIAWFH